MITGIENIADLTDTRNAWAEYLNKFQWEWYFTLTFDKKTSIRTAYRKFYKWKNWLKKALGDSVIYFLIAEKPRYEGDNIHFHGFIQGIKDEKPYKWKQAWHSLSGISDIQSYDKTQGASYYLSDKIVYKQEDIRFSQDLNEIKSSNEN